MLFLILALALSGLVVGALGRLLVPGRNPMSIGMTILVGLAGSFLGGIVGRLVFGFRYRYAYGLGLLISVVCAALIVAFMSRNRMRRRL